MLMSVLGHICLSASCRNTVVDACVCVCVCVVVVGSVLTEEEVMLSSIKKKKTKQNE